MRPHRTSPESKSESQRQDSESSLSQNPVSPSQWVREHLTFTSTKSRGHLQGIDLPSFREKIGSSEFSNLLPSLAPITTEN